MKSHKFLISASLACMLSGTSILAMDDPIEEDKKSPQTRPLYTESEFEKFMLLKEMAVIYREQQDYIPEDVANKIIETQRKFYKEAGEIANSIIATNHIVNNDNGIKTLAMLHPSDDLVVDNFVLEILCKKHPDAQHIQINGFRGITDLSTLQGMKNLKSIYMHYCTGITDLSPLKNLPNLKEIHISGCTDITDLSPLQELANLCVIFMNGCIGIADLSSLENLPNLTRISINSCTGITDLSPLKNMPNLEVISLEDCTGITNEQVDALKQALPNLSIGWYPA